MASAEEPGLLRIQFADRNESAPVTVLEAHTKMISGAATTYPTGETLKAQPTAGSLMLFPSAKCFGGRIIAKFVSDAADTIESEECGLNIPVLRFENNGGKIGKPIGSKIITFETMTGFTVAGTIDVVCTAGGEQRLAYEEVPSTEVWMINPNLKPHCYIGDDTT